jgi:hypothetical protein
MLNVNVKQGRTLTRLQMKELVGGKAANYNTYWKCSPGTKSSFLYVCHWSDPSENFCAGEATQCVYTNKPCMYAECY